MAHNKQSSGFTLLEILLVVAAIAVLAGIVIVAINPGRQLGETRNTARRSDVDSVLNALYQYSLDNRGLFPSSTDTNLRMLGTSVTGCAINCGGTASNANSTSSQQSTPTSFLDNSQSTFAGSFSNTSYSNNLLSLSSGQTSGSYTSDVKDAGGSATWSNFSWVPSRPTGKPLPNSSATESGYPNGNMDMNGNVLLLHMDESNGATTFSDSSGSGLNGTCAATCPTSGTAGKFATSLNFNGINQGVFLGSSNLLRPEKTSISLWLKTTDTNPNGSVIYRWRTYGIGFYLGGGSDVGKIKFGAYGTNLLSNTITTPSTYNNGVWHNVVGTFDGNTLSLYLDGVIINSKNMGPIFYQTPGGAAIGRDGNFSGSYFKGQIDEFSLFNRPLSADEVSDMYQRGALSLKYQVKSCAVADCSDGNFVGPDGTNNSYYSENNNSSNTTPSFSLSNITDNRYFQYKSFLDTNNQTLTPEMKSVTISDSVGGTENNQNISSNTASACLDLSSFISPTYITAIPFDPKIGSAEKTYYAVKKTSGGRINIQACAPENSTVINETK